MSVQDTGRLPSLSGKELRWKIEHTLSNPPQATAVPAGENDVVMTQAQASLMAWDFWLDTAFHTIGLPSCDADTIHVLSKYDQSSAYIWNLTWVSSTAKFLLLTMLKKCEIDISFENWIELHCLTTLSKTRPTAQWREGRWHTFPVCPCRVLQHLNLLTFNLTGLRPYCLEDLTTVQLFQIARIVQWGQQ